MVLGEGKGSAVKSKATLRMQAKALLSASRASFRLLTLRNGTLAALAPPERELGPRLLPPTSVGGRARRLARWWRRRSKRLKERRLCPRVLGLALCKELARASSSDGAVKDELADAHVLFSDRLGCAALCHTHAFNVEPAVPGGDKAIVNR